LERISDNWSHTEQNDDLNIEMKAVSMTSIPVHPSTGDAAGIFDVLSRA